MNYLRLIPIYFIFSTYLFSYEYKGEFGVDGVAYAKYTDEILTYGDMDISFKNSYFDTTARAEFIYSSKYTDRRYLLINELYITKEFDDYVLSFGKKIKYWGELEGYNIADVYNQKNYLKDPFDKSAKYGTVGFDITRYYDENFIEFGMKLYEDDIYYPKTGTPYAPFPLPYEKELHLSDKSYTPTYYLSASFLDDSFVESETKLVLLHGYDTKRDIIKTSATLLSQYAYRVNKALLLSHIIYADTIFKTELSYTDVIEYTPISDYTQLSFGVEKSFYELMGSDITFYGEYYRYLYKDDNKVKGVDISEIYDDDIFLALRFSFNDVRGTEMKFGVLEDIKKDERVVKISINSRIMDSFILNGEYLNIISNETTTLLNQFDNSSRFILGVEYTF